MSLEDPNLEDVLNWYSGNLRDKHPKNLKRFERSQKLNPEAAITINWIASSNLYFVHLVIPTLVLRFDHFAEARAVWFDQNCRRPVEPLRSFPASRHCPQTSARQTPDNDRQGMGRDS